MLNKKFGYFYSERRNIVISLDCIGPQNTAISGGIGTHIYEIYNCLKTYEKENILLLTGRGYDKPQGIVTIELPFLNIRYLKLISFHLIASLYILLYYRNIKPKVVHIHYLEVAFFPALIARLIGSKVIVTSHGYYNKKKFHLLLRPFIDLMWKIILKLIDTLIVLSDDAKDYYHTLLQKYHIYHKIDIVVVPNGSISSQFLELINKEKSIQENNDSKVILFVGRLVKQKNVDGLLDAFERIKEKHLALWIVGDGPDKRWFENYSSKLVKKSKIKFWGWQPRIIVYELMKEADIFVLPSLWEGMPISLLEAYALGKKCICHKNAFTETIPGIFLLNSPDSDEIAKKILIALNKDIQNDRHFISQFTWEVAASKLIKIYKKYNGDEIVG
jgi:glycosyltransferase involved in cell wall biosynthesis